jgi:uncharacterized protein YkwD
MVIRPILIATLSMLTMAADPPPAADAQAAAAPSSLEQQVLAGINEVRTNPAAYAATLRRYRGYFEDNIVHLPDSDVGLRTKEGVAAVDEAIAFLANQAPMPPFRSAAELVEAAKAHAADQALAGGYGHIGSDGSDARARIKKHGGSGFMAEALAYGANDAAGVVRQLIIDDGVPTRPHRKILFDKKYRRAGVACGGHLQYRSICVIDLSTFVGLDAPAKPRPAPPPDIDIF